MMSNNAGPAEARIYELAAQHGIVALSRQSHQCLAGCADWRASGCGRGYGAPVQDLARLRYRRASEA